LSTGCPLTAIRRWRSGPGPGPNGFSWSNGSRLYYANLAFPLSTAPGFAGFSAAVVSRTHNVQAAAAGDQSAWMDPVIASKQNAALLSDKDDIWVDNASSSPFFGNVYLCNVAFRGTNSIPEPVVPNSSTDGGRTWRQRQLSPATNNAQTGGRQGCAIRTDSAGVVYIVWEGTDVKTGQSVFFLTRSFDGGNNFEKAFEVATVHDVGCPTPVSGRIVFDGFAGTRTDSFPSLSIANGVPTGADATNMLVLTWPDGALNHEQALVQTSADGGLTWSAPVNAAQAGDRPSGQPGGGDLAQRHRRVPGLQRLPAAIPDNHGQPPPDAGSHPPRRRWGGWCARGLHHPAPGDGRRRQGHHKDAQPRGDLRLPVRRGLTGLRGHGVDGRAQRGRVSRRGRLPAVPDRRIPDRRPSPLTDCPPGFGNGDIYSGSFPDPTP
jgi:hypothetical protein